jgi:type II secretory pathway pseudopilin PulG
MMMKRQTNAAVSRRGRRAGFSFTEVLFAVMVLGIGFIMIAAIFPVAIRQTQTTLEESQGALTAKAALAYLQSIASDEAFPVTGTGATVPVMALSDVNTDPKKLTGYYWARGNFINSANARLGWVPLYRRGVESDGSSSAYAEVFLIPVQSRNRSQFYSQAFAGSGRTRTDIDVPTDSQYVNLAPHRAKVTVKYDTDLQGGRLAVTQGSEFAAPGAYVVISNGEAVGRVYQLGAFDNDKGNWTLTPGGDMLPNADGSGTLDVNLTNETAAYIVGRGLVDPESDQTTVGGPTQETGIYVGFIMIPAAPVVTP